MIAFSLIELLQKIQKTSRNFLLLYGCIKRAKLQTNFGLRVLYIAATNPPPLRGVEGVLFCVHHLVFAGGSSLRC
ncbi:hypothetical protein DEV91_12093 [Phyllobacterium brassicacearum]|nr:hypothetical protein DEV91_12093 [Phyllobacterium brassicacearum]